MKIRLLSDLHIECYPFEIPRLVDDLDTVLVLAGDIGTIQRRSELEAFLRQACLQFRAVIYVLGNHEYYHHSWPDALKDIRGWALPNNLYLMERDVIEIDDVAFLGATLWTDFDGGSPMSMMRCLQGMMDFEVIESSGGEPGTVRLSPMQIFDYHRQTVSWLSEAMQQARGRNRAVVVVCHHGVSRRSIHPMYATSTLNGGFVSDLEALWQDGCPDLVLHGHVHSSFRYEIPTRLGATQVVVNPRGYTQQEDTQENGAFDPRLLLEV